MYSKIDLSKPPMPVCPRWTVQGKKYEAAVVPDGWTIDGYAPAATGQDWDRAMETLVLTRRHGAGTPALKEAIARR